MRPTEFFKFLRAPLANSRWSWGGVRSDGAVFLRTWKEQEQTINGSTYFLVLDGKLSRADAVNLGFNERRRHVDRVRSGAACYLVMCSAVDFNARPRRIKDFDEKNVVVGGEILEVQGNLWIKAEGVASVGAIRTSSTRIFGEIEGIEVGSIFESRAELANAGIHPPPVAGISGSEKEGADSIVLSGGYEDDEDLGDSIIYTGQGGNDANTNKQVADQELTRGNKGLAISYQQGFPVRVTRGAKHKSPWSPKEGYKYCGVYQVTDCWHERGKSGFKIWRFRLEQTVLSASLKISISSEDSMPLDTSGGAEKPSRKKTTTLRVVRDTTLSINLKRYYDYTCQVCGSRLEGPGGPYAEAAHIRPLGRPHNGPDTTDNILCLCPNHHFLFDVGAFGVADDLTLVGISGILTVLETHEISSAHLHYHREHFGLN